MAILGLKFPYPGGWITSRRIRLRQVEEAKDHKDEGEARFREWLPLIGSWFRSRRFPDKHDPELSFIPCPKVTFLIDPPDGLICSICKSTNLKFQSNREGLSSRRRRKDVFSDSVPAIAACGHVAGSQCMERWLRNNDTCPFCRELLVYDCGHSVPLKPITTDEIHLIPPTLPSGGFIPELCAECYKASLWASVSERYRATKSRFSDAMTTFDACLLDQAATLMLDAKTDFESFMVDQYFSKVSHRILAYW